MTHLRARWSALLAALVPAVLLALAGCTQPPQAAPANYLFCFWNVENFFDDKLDHRKGPGDREYDPLFAEHPELLKLKLKKLTKALLELNDGKGPDILAIVEVESRRAAELLQEALNARLTDPSLHYKNVLMKPVAAGRHIAPAILTRLPVDADRTRLLGRSQRILEGHVKVKGHTLVVIAAHWTSQLDKGSEARREHYADAIYGRVRAMLTANPQADVLICGDFNETPDAPAVTEHLHATANVKEVQEPGDDGPRLLNLMAGKDPQQYGTHYYRRWLIYDQIVVTPGMLDQQGWSFVPGTVARVDKDLSNPKDRLHRPWKFGGPRVPMGARGYSDHFPVTVRLRVAE
jgi:endonuclease/exonuclease/phosphatase family metal-dependent hydrolase